MLALDPPDDGATIGGIVARGDSGPLRGRYGGPRDLVVGMRVALSDGTLAKSGGKVIKNVAGYDLAKLFAGSFGTLGAIVEVSVRLHPLAPATATAWSAARDPASWRARRRAGARAARAPRLDVRWSGGRGAVLARFGGGARTAGRGGGAAAARARASTPRSSRTTTRSGRSSARASARGPSW